MSINRQDTFTDKNQILSVPVNGIADSFSTKFSWGTLLNNGTIMVERAWKPDNFID